MIGLMQRVSEASVAVDCWLGSRKAMGRPEHQQGQSLIGSGAGSEP